MYSVISISSLFALINPIGIAPIILTVTENFTIKEYNRTISKGSILACCILLLFALMGKLIFSFYGITVYAFKIAGGILFLRIGMNMLEVKVSRTKSTPKESKEATGNEDIGLTPTNIISILNIFDIKGNNIYSVIAYDSEPDSIQHIIVHPKSVQKNTL